MTLPDIDTIATLGGALQNFAPVEDPTTDLDAGADNASRTNVAMMTHTAVRAMRRFLGHATTPADPVSGFIHDAVWGSSAPVKATVTKGGTGIYPLTWPTTVQDELGVAHTLNLRCARAWVEITGSVRYSAEARATAGNVVEVRVFIDGGAGADALNDAAGFNIVVVAW